MQKFSRQELFTIALAIALCSTGIIFLDRIFSAQVSGLNQEIFSALLASIFTVATMTIVIRLQSKQDKEKEFSARLFEKKLMIYQELLSILFKADDDNVLADDEIQQMENKIGEASIVAGAALVSCFSQFMLQVKIYGCLYPRSMDQDQRRHFLQLLAAEELLCKAKARHQITEENFGKLFVTLDDLIQGIREDLDVVDGNIRNEVSRFVSVGIDGYKMKRNPSLIDK